MIKRYTDHAANERTYLSWIRTAIAVMTFGFLIEKFDLFLSYIGKASGAKETFTASHVIEFVGLGLLMIGVLIIITSTVRFFNYKRMIESDLPFSYNVRKTSVVLSVLMGCISVFMIIYLGHQLL